MNGPDIIELPPHSVESEQAVIGGLLLVPDAWDRVVDAVAEADFYRDDHRRIFRQVRSMLASGQAIDALTVAEALKQAGEADQTGGINYLVEIANNTPSAANIRRYAETVREKAILRRLLATADEIRALALERSNAPVGERIDRAQELLAGMADGSIAAGEPRTIQEALGLALEGIEIRYERDGGGPSGLPTSFADLDHMLCGMQPGDLIVVAGRPSMGKTAFALNIAENVVLAGGVGLVFSLEMGEEQLALRAIASQGRVDLNRLRTGRLSDEDWDRMVVALGKLHQARLIIDPATDATTAQMEARARRAARKEGRLDLVVIDYLQLMAGDGRTRNEELGDITRRLKKMAKRIACPVMVLSQLSRKVEERTNKRPVMSDLRESGAIEQDADVILLLYREDYYKPDTADKGVAEVIVAKQRMGPTGEVRLAFRPEFSRFDDLAPDPCPATLAGRSTGFRGGES